MAVNGINLVTPSVSGIDFTVGNTISNKNENVVQSFSDYLKNAIKQVDELENSQRLLRRILRQAKPTISMRL